MHAPGDADVLIVQKTVDSALHMDTLLVGEDTDLLILLCYQANLDSHSIFFRPESKKKSVTSRLFKHNSVLKYVATSSFCIRP